jgi:hypothetical protein
VTTPTTAPARRAAAARAPAATAPVAGRRKRGQGPTVALSAQILRPEWERLHQLAVSEGVSLQQLIIHGLSLVFREKGLPGIEST